jgi:hypothetical protein
VERARNLAEPVEVDGWLKTSQRAAAKKPWDKTALDEGHYVRKTKAAVAAIKSRIDTGQPRTQNRWRGRNFDTIARCAAEKSMADEAVKHIDTALDRVDRHERQVERKKNPYDTAANPALLQRRIAGPSWKPGAKSWQAPKQTIGRTVKEAQDSKIYSLKPPWVKRLSEDKLLQPGRIRPGNIAVPADNVLPPPEGRTEADHEIEDLGARLGLGATPAGILLGLKGTGRGDTVLRRSRNGDLVCYTEALRDR